MRAVRRRSAATSAPRSRRPRKALGALAALLGAACSGSGSDAGPHGDATAPAVPAGVRAETVSATRVDVTWLPASDDVGVTGYRVRRDGAEVATPTAAAFADLGLSPATTYCYTVAAYDAEGNESAPSAEDCATTLADHVPDATAPSTPGDALASAASATRIDVTWSASTDDVAVEGYRVRRGGVELGTSLAAAFADLGVSPATSYCYTVAAYDAAGNESSPSVPACATTPNDTTPPATPARVLAEAISPARIAVSWTASDDDVGTIAYRIRRAGRPVADVTSLTWEDPTLRPQTEYCYTVAAYDDERNESAPSAPACATTPRRPVPATTSAEMELTRGQEIVVDGVTGLVWQAGPAGVYDWYTATGTTDATLNPTGVAACDRVIGGLAGWRLPTDAELLDIAAYDLSPAIDTTMFGIFTAPDDLYWSSTPLASGTARFWEIRSGFLGAGLRSTAYAVRCVLGGPGLGPSLTAPGDGTVVDASTGLIWQQGRSADALAHDGATGYCAALSVGGGTGWRLPTVKEAKSIAPIDLEKFPGTAAEPFWTSTPVYAGGWWWVEPVGGEVYLDASGSSLWTRCVRGPP